MKSKWIAFAALMLSGFLLVALPPAPAAGAAKDAAAADTADKALVDLNSATAEELQKLPGVSAATAKKIIAGRPYASVDDLAKAGVSKTTLNKIKSLVTVADSAPAKDAPASGDADKMELVDLNSATAEELKKLPGVSAATAKKIIAGRPYTSVDDLTKAGVSKTTLGKIKSLITVAVSAPAKTTDKTAPEKEADAPKTAAGDKVDLNTATAAELEALPGVGAATSKKIIAGRPYKSVDDLSKSGISKSALAKLEPLVTVADSAPAAPTPAAADAPAPEKEADAPKVPYVPQVADSDKVNLNTATADALEQLPGIGPAVSKKIIAGRPYKSMDDVAKAGVSKTAIAKFQPFVTLADSTSAKPSVTPAPAKEKEADAPKEATAAADKEVPSKTVEARTPPVKGMVWVNTTTKIYHKEGDAWYGKTKTGKFMTEADAIAAGYHESKQDKKKDAASDAKDDSKSTNDSSK